MQNAKNLDKAANFKINLKLSHGKSWGLKFRVPFKVIQVTKPGFSAKPLYSTITVRNLAYDFILFYCFMALQITI